ncbi:MAG: glutathione S-transferase [Robiginitomaculum sp.]|nr:MAG: glutathione S-transferase [Robiginitomaculum sp.]
MKLYSTQTAPNPERVLCFLREKNVTDLEIVPIDLFKGEHRTKEYRVLSPFAQVPALELDDGRVLTESRAICRYLEGVYPEPNLLGEDPIETAFIEMWDRRVEMMWLMPLANWLRHGHPAFAALEKQIEELAPRGEKSFRRFAKFLDTELQTRDFVAGDRFTIADITAFATIGFARVARWKPDAEETPNLHAWRQRMFDRPCGAKS